MQVCEVLEGKTAFNRPKRADKAAGVSSRYIYSFSTLSAYKRHCGCFVAYCKDKHGSRTLEDCRQYVDEWLETRFSLSAYTVKLEAAAVAKLYGCRSTDFVSTPPRIRSMIRRSRGPVKRDKHFSLERNKDIIEFCRSTGLRRRELSLLTGDKLIERSGEYFIRVDRGGKGGRIREAPVIGDIENVIRHMNAAGDGLVWPRIPSKMDVHSYRAEYATSIYNSRKRPLGNCQKASFWNSERGRYESAVYWFRKDRSGEWLDKAAMLEASRALGHNRISVVGEHYIRQ